FDLVQGPQDQGEAVSRGDEITNLRNARMRPQPPLLTGASSSLRPPCLGEWQEMLYFAHPWAEHPLVAQTPPWDLFICAKDLFVEAMAGPHTNSIFKAVWQRTHRRPIRGLIPLAECRMR